MLIKFIQTLVLASVQEDTKKKLNIGFGKHLRSIREQRGLSQEALAYEAGLSYNQIGRIERGISSPTLVTMRAIADVLGVSLVNLVSFEG